MNVALTTALVAVALGLRLAWAWGDLESLLRYATSDDAFYYFQIAHNLIAGAGPSIDGETPTNGFHPLWLALLLPVQAIASTPEQGLRLGLTLGAVLGALSVVPLTRVIARLAQPTGDARRSAVAFAVAGLYAIHPTAILESVNGLETALTVFMTAWTVERFIALCGPDPRAAPTSRSAVQFGVLGGLLLLARTDSVFLWATLLAWLAFATSLPRRVRFVLTAGLVSSACVLPWLIWNQSVFGSLVPISAVALPELLRADFVATHGDAIGPLLDRSRFLLQRAFGDALPHLYLTPRGGSLVPAALACLAAAASAVHTAGGRARLRPLIAPLAGVLFTLFWHAGVRWWTREWYFAPAGWVLFALLGVCAAELHARAGTLPGARRAAARASMTAAWVGACLWLCVPAFAATWRIDSAHRVQQLEAAQWLATRTPPDARVGAFNAGIYSYFSSRTVVNLDGVVNADAYAARRDGRLLDYVLSMKLEYVVDWRGTLPMLRCAQRTDIDCRRIATVGDALPGFAGSPVAVLTIGPAVR